MTVRAVSDSVKIRDYMSHIIVTIDTNVGGEAMAVIPQEEYEHSRVINLGGTEGNAYVLLGIAHGALVQLGMDPDIYLKIMRAGDYKHLVTTFNELLGGYFTIVLPDGINSLEDL